MPEKRKRTPLNAKSRKRKHDYDVKYDADNVVKLRVGLNKKKYADLIAVWESIPNKSQWLKDRLREYAKQTDSE